MTGCGKRASPPSSPICRCERQSCGGDCHSELPIFLNGGSVEVFSDWFVRRGDYLIATADFVSEFDNGVLEVRAYTKSRSDPGDGTEVSAGTKITASVVGRRSSAEWSPRTGTGLSELVRFGYKCSTPSGSWVLFRMVTNVWFDAVKA